MVAPSIAKPITGYSIECHTNGCQIAHKLHNKLLETMLRLQITPMLKVAHKSTLLPIYAYFSAVGKCQVFRKRWE